MFNKSSTTAVTVFIVEDEPVLRAGLREHLEETGEMLVVGECSLSGGAVEQVYSCQPRVVLLGTTSPWHQGLEICRSIVQRCPYTRVIVMTHAEETGELFEAIRSGASGYVEKLADSAIILRAVREADWEYGLTMGMTAVYPEVSARLLEEFHIMARDPRWSSVVVPLSSREMELLRQMKRGISNKEIAHVLGITPQTVKNHLTSIFRKLDVDSRTQAVLAGLRYGWISLEEELANGDQTVLPPSGGGREGTPAPVPGPALRSERWGGPTQLNSEETKVRGGPAMPL